jgi:hypothetical protein
MLSNTITACCDTAIYNIDINTVLKENEELKKKCASYKETNTALAAKALIAQEKAALRENAYKPKRILKNGDYMTVLWEDGTKTIVKRAPDEPESDYAAFTAAIGIRVFGSNSALKRIVESAEVQGKKKKKKKEEPDKVTQAFDKVGKSFCKSAVALIEEMAKLREAEYDQQKTDE